MSAAAAALALASPAIGQTLMPALLEPIPDLTADALDESVTIDLAAHFGIEGMEGDRMAQFDTDFGIVDVELFSQDAPLTVENFFGYVKDDPPGNYDNSFIHRVAQDFVVQGGGFKAEFDDQGQPIGIEERDPVVNEFNRSNLRGTLAMAKFSGDPDSATSQWFVNLTDNSANLDTQNGGFTVFARVIGSGMDVWDEIGELPTFSLGGAFNATPLQNLQQDQDAVMPENFVKIATVREASLFPSAAFEAAVLTAEATSSNESLVEAEVVGGELRLSFPSKATGSAMVTVTVADNHGNEAEGGFEVTLDLLPPEVVSAPLGRAVLAGSTARLSVEAASNRPLSYQWLFEGEPIPGATDPELAVEDVDPSDAGNYSVQAIDEERVTTSEVAALSVVDSFGRLANLSTRGLVGEGDEVMIAGFVLSGQGSRRMLLRALGPELQERNVANFLPDPSLDLRQGADQIGFNDNWGDAPNAAEAEEAFDLVGAPELPDGSLDAALLDGVPATPITAIVSGSGQAGGEPRVALVEVFDAEETPSAADATSRLENISTRARVGSGDGVLIPGFVVTDEAPVNVLVRALGPGLQGSPGLEDDELLPDPNLQLLRIFNDKPNETVAANDDWEGGASPAGLAEVAAAVGAPPLEPGSKDAALFATLEPGLYTAIASSSVNGEEGIALVEVFRAD